MKRILTFALAVALLLTMAACTQEEAAAPTTVPTTVPNTTETPTEPAPPVEPEWEPGVSRATFGEGYYTTLTKGTEVNVLGAYEVTDPSLVSGKRVLLLDDILTTGATAGECARVLLTAGAQEICCAAVAVTRQRAKTR